MNSYQQQTKLEVAYVYNMELMKTLSRDVGLLIKIRPFVIDSTLKHLCESLFHSHLKYGCILWSIPTAVQLNQIHKLQKRTIRTSTFSKYNDHTS